MFGWPTYYSSYGTTYIERPSYEKYVKAISRKRKTKKAKRGKK